MKALKLIFSFFQIQEQVQKVPLPLCLKIMKNLNNQYFQYLFIAELDYFQSF